MSQRLVDRDSQLNGARAAVTASASMTREWKALGALVVLLAYVHVFMEWLFFVTKPSFLSGLSGIETALTLLVAPLPLAALAALVIGALWMIARATVWLRAERIVFRLARAMPAFLGACCVLILVDNFTQTMLGFGIRHTAGTGRWLYALTFVALLVQMYRYTSRLMADVRRRSGLRALLLAPLVLVAFSLIGIIVTWISSPANQVGDRGAVSMAGKLPNILLLGGDGLSATHMSCYGCRRDTTPFLRAFSRSALVAQNHFTNAGSSGASIASMFTSKLPTHTRLIYPPDILKGRDAYQHLPGILRRAGYHSIEISMRHYADAYDLNLRDSFDVANFRQVGRHSLSRIGPGLGIAFSSQAYFLGRIWERVEERLLHILGLRAMVDAFEEATTTKKAHYRDRIRIEELLRFVEQSPEPFFAHLLLEGTHGETFQPSRRVFSRGRRQNRLWMASFYDDAILEFDANVAAVVDRLQSLGKLERTIVVIHSDHGMQWTVDVRVPMIIRFPDAPLYAGKVASTNTQNLDVAPTLLEYLRLPVPEWMEGRSMLAAAPDRLRPILSIRTREEAKSKGGWYEMPDMHPPFFSLQYVIVTICNRSFTLDLGSNAMVVSEVAGHSAPCDGTEIPDQETIRALIIKHLRESGYDVSSIEALGPAARS